MKWRKCNNFLKPLINGNIKHTKSLNFWLVCKNYFILFWETIFWHRISTEKYLVIWYSLERTYVNVQVFPNSTKGWVGKSSQVGGWNRKLYWVGGNIFTGWRKPEQEWFWWFERFSKLKTAFCEYWTSIKIKTNMTCVSKEFEIKTKMEQE